MVTHELQICRLQNNELDFTKYNSPFGTRVFKNINANPAQNYFLLCLFFLNHAKRDSNRATLQKE